MTRLDDLLVWAQERWEDPPVRVHRREVWSDPEGGSILGAPAWTGEYRRWIEDNPEELLIKGVASVRCGHPLHSPKDRKHLAAAESAWRSTDGLRCPDCDETGRCEREVLRYRWPMRVALAAIASHNVPDNRPKLDAVIWQLAEHEWSVGIAASVLADRFPLMAVPRIAASWTLTALSRCRAAYREDAPRVRDKSEAQKNAEAAA